MEKRYLDVKRRLLEQKQYENLDGYMILIANDNTLDGCKIESFTVSKDEKWVCIPRLDDCDKVYVPICYEVDGCFQTYLKYGSMLSSSKVFVLHKA